MHHPSLLRLNRTFLCVLVWEKLWVIQVLDFECVLSKPEWFSCDGIMIGQKLLSDKILFL